MEAIASQILNLLPQFLGGTRSEEQFRMSIVFGRAVLCLNGILLLKLSIEYIIGSRARDPRSKLPSLSRLFLPEVFEGPAIGLLYPFMGCAYLTIAILNALAGLLFAPFEASIVLLVTGMVFHMGSSVTRMTMPFSRAAYYQPGKCESMSLFQSATGMLDVVGAGALNEMVSFDVLLLILIGIVPIIFLAAIPNLTLATRLRM